MNSQVAKSCDNQVSFCGLKFQCERAYFIVAKVNVSKSVKTLLSSRYRTTSIGLVDEYMIGHIDNKKKK